MLKVYAVWNNGVSRLVKATSKKEIKNVLGECPIEYWGKPTKKLDSLYRDLPVIENGSIHTSYEQ